MEKQIWQAEIIISAAFPLLPLLLSLGAPSESAELPLLLLLQVSGLAKVKVQSIKKEHSNSTYLRCGLCSTRALTQLESGSGTAQRRVEQQIGLQCLLRMTSQRR